MLESLNGADLLLGGLALLACLVVAVYYLIWFRVSGSRKLIPEKTPSPSIPLSVIICAHNEKKNLEKNLPFIMAQDYPQFEVLVVNDGSWDGTADLLDTLAAANPRLKVVTLDHEKVKKTGKKLALTLGIKAAQCDHFVLTDADCYPASTQWLSHIAAGFSGGKDLVLGVSPYARKNSILNLFVRFETLITAMQYVAMARKGKAYMGVGRNMAYTRRLFFSVKGFANHHHLNAGDDDLFVQDAATANNVNVCVHPESQTLSDSAKGFRSWWRQKRRHLYVGKHYGSKVRRFLGLLALVQVLFYMVMPVWFVYAAFWWLPLCVYGMWLLVRFPVTLRVGLRMNQHHILVAYPLLDLMYAAYLFAAGINAWLAKKADW
jgi:poly-beta-1,6-N-acetyl-D-glucosamine synthase